VISPPTSSSLRRKRKPSAPYAIGRDPERAPIPVCAVVDCPEVGHRHTCPADGAAHGHGRIHYEDCHSALMFRVGDWFLICQAHYAECVKARRAWEIENQRQRNAEAQRKS
jgi:hypothetical protein